MRVILVANPKGGCVKTTITTNLACFYARWGFHSVVLDVDAQCSSSDWHKSRPGDLPRVRVSSTPPGLLLQRIEQARGRDIAKSLVIVDLPAAFPVLTELEVMAACDLVLLPMLASPIDTRAMVHHLFDLHRHYFDGENKVDMAVIANRVRPNTRLQREFSEGFLQRIRFPLIGELRETVNYPSAAAEGRGIVDLAPRQVIKDLLQWRDVLQWVNTRLWPSLELDMGSFLQ